MSEQKTPYNQIDFVIPAPKFRIVFSYMSNQGVSFVREYLLRLLKLTPCKPTQIANYFGFSKYETEIALADLERNHWISWQADGTIALSTEGLQLFQGESPQIPNLMERGGEYRMELLDSNFLQPKDCDKTNTQAIELSVDNGVRSKSKELVQKAFQNRFRQLLEDDIISLDDKEIALYKIDAIEPKGGMEYFRFTQSFELMPETGEAKERHDVPNVLYQDCIHQAITTQVEQFRRSNNLRELRASMEELGDNDTLRILFGGKFDVIEFGKIQYEQQNSLYFLGQTYHQEEMFKQINQTLDKLDKKSQKKLYWLAPSDIYWGKQRKIHDQIQNLIDKSKDKYDFRLYLPVQSERNKHEKQQWKHEFREISEKHLYAFCEGFLNDNTEILFLEDKFAVVCYHAKLPDYPVTLPIGFMATKAREVTFIQDLVVKYLSSFQSDEGYGVKDFGLLNKT